MSNTRKAQEYILVGSGNQAMAKSGNLRGTGSTFNILDGQFGVVCAEHNAHIGYHDFLGATNNPASAAPNVYTDISKIQIVQGTSRSANTAGYQAWAHETPGANITGVIDATSVKSFSGKLYVVPTYSSVVVDAIGTPVDEEEYAVHVTLRSVRKDRDYGRNADQITVTQEHDGSVTDGKDYLIQNLMYQLNLRSSYVNTLPHWAVNGGNKEVIGFALDLDGAGTGTAIGALTLGDPIPFVTINGTTINYIVDEYFLETANQWIANSTPVTATTEIQNINITTAGAGSGGNTSDAFVIMGLAENLAAAHDGIYANLVDVSHTELGGYFTLDSSLNKVDGSFPIEPDGSSRLLRIRYDERAFAQGGTQQLNNESDELLTSPNYIADASKYTVGVLDCKQYVPGSAQTYEQNTRVFLLFPGTDDSATTDVVTGVTASTTATSAKTDWNTIFGTWVESIPGVQLTGASVAGTIIP